MALTRIQELPVKRATVEFSGGEEPKQILPPLPDFQYGIMAYKLSQDGDTVFIFTSADDEICEAHYLAARASYIAGRNEDLWYIVPPGQDLSASIDNVVNISVYVQYVEIPLA